MISWMLNSSRPDPNWYVNALYYSVHLDKSITFRKFVLLTCYYGRRQPLEKVCIACSLSCSVQSVTRYSTQQNAAMLHWEEMKHLSLWLSYQLISTESSFFGPQHQACCVFKYRSLSTEFLTDCLLFLQRIRLTEESGVGLSKEWEA